MRLFSSYLCTAVDALFLARAGAAELSGHKNAHIIYLDGQNEFKTTRSSSGSDWSKCGCSLCTSSVLERPADGYSVGSRIDWFVANTGQSEQDACSIVCGSEFPDICGECDPWQCGGGCNGCSWDGGSNCPDSWCNESQSNCNSCNGSWFGSSGSGTGGIDIGEQGSGTVQIVNESSETNLHVFFQSNNAWERWIKVGGDGVIYDPINWGQDDTSAFDPLGAKKLSEAVIPQGGSIVLTIPDLNPPQFQIIAIKMVDPGMQGPLPPSKASDWNGSCPREVIHGQWPILIEAGKDVVADASAVDGINFRIKYELTTSETDVQMMEIKENPCNGLAEQYLVRGPNNSVIGCRSPPKVDCNGPKPGETCDCFPGTQNCAFNECSVKEFDIPNDLMKFFYVYDDGDHTGMPVKSFINNESNIKQNSDFDKYCKQMHSDTWQNGGNSDFTCYCYDYNDVSSSPWLRAPHKIKVVYFDL